MLGASHDFLLPYKSMLIMGCPTALIDEQTVHELQLC
jgi:hypothetical protein